MILQRFLTFGLLAASAVPCLGNYADDTGFNQLKAELGAAMLTGNSVGVSHVETSFLVDGVVSYLPQAGSGTFPGAGYWDGKSFTAKGGAGGFSDHAYNVAARYYGITTDPDVYRASMAPAIVDVDCWNATNWSGDFLAPGPTRAAPVVEIRAVQNHSWISYADAATTATTNDMLRRQDYSINRDGYVCCVGVNNGATTTTPDLLAAAYNVISAGLTNGDHSRGPTTSDMDGPGRRKPEIVAPLEVTSFSTAYVSSAAVLLREKANMINTANARKPKTLKAVLLAGATKDEFPAWSKTAAHPIDAIYGAGELNIYNSYQILNGGEQPANNAAGRPYRAWDNQSLSPGGTADYRLNIPAGMYGVELSAFAVWHRTLTNITPVGFTLTPDTLVNFDLTLFLDPAAGGAAVTIDSSISTLYNMEHVWKRDLPAGNYRLRVSRNAAAGTTQDFTIAWRLSTAPHNPAPQMQSSGGNLNFTFPGLIPGQPYSFQSSPDFAAWTDIHNFTAASSTEMWATVKPPASRLFYRLLPVLP